MKIPSHEDCLKVLLLQAADDGRGDILFGESIARVADAAAPFMIGRKFPSVYLEFPFSGEPFMDITMLYNELDPDEHIDSDAASETDEVIRWYAQECSHLDPVAFGFELDTSKAVLPRAAIHFQPRNHTELVRPFCEAVGEPGRADLYLSFNERMPEGWELSFFGMFRGRPDYPLRVCGYLSRDQVEACAEDVGYIRSVFEQVGFKAWDSSMLEQVSLLMSLAPGAADFQFDVMPDGSLSQVFAIDIQFDIQQPEDVCSSFEGGPAGAVMQQFEDWGIADGRWKIAANASFARALPVVREDGTACRLAFSIMPQWTKARWTGGILQPSKLYYLAAATLLG